MMRQYDATEIAYKNGYAQGLIDAQTKADVIRQKSLFYLAKELRKTRIDLGHAEQRHNAEEVSNLQTKIEVLEWVMGVVIKEDDNG